MFFQDQFQKIYEKMPKRPLEALHSRAMECFLEGGLPEEKQKLFSFEKLYQTSLEPLSEEKIPQEKLSFLEAIPSPKIILVNGVFDEKLSLPGEMETIFLPLEEAMKKREIFLYNHLLPKVQREKDPFSLLNIAFLSKGGFLYFPENFSSSSPLHIVQITIASKKEGFLFPRWEIFVNPRAKVDLFFSEFFFESEKLPKTLCWVNQNISLHVEKEAKVTFSHFSSLAKEKIYSHQFHSHLKEKGELSFVDFSMGEALQRKSFQFFLEGEGAKTSIGGLYMPKEEGRIEIISSLSHLAPSTFSHQLWKGVVKDRGASSFSGEATLFPSAKGAECRQINRNLLLSDLAKAFSLPILNIFVDEVKAFHGATISEIEAEDLFYLESRGFSEEEAKKILLQGFCQEIIDRVQGKFIRKEVARLC